MEVKAAELETLTTDELALLKIYRQLSLEDKQFAFGLFMRLLASAPSTRESYGAIFNYGEINSIGHVFNPGLSGGADNGAV